jgi:hypothetical protein
MFILKEGVVASFKILAQNLHVPRENKEDHYQTQPVAAEYKSTCY